MCDWSVLHTPRFDVQRHRGFGNWLIRLVRLHSHSLVDRDRSVRWLGTLKSLRRTTSWISQDKKVAQNSIQDNWHFTRRETGVQIRRIKVFEDRALEVTKEKKSRSQVPPWCDYIPIASNVNLSWLLIHVIKFQAALFSRSSHRESLQPLAYRSKTHA